jgi:hypothetical protein
MAKIRVTGGYPPAAATTQATSIDTYESDRPKPDAGGGGKKGS